MACKRFGAAAFALAIAACAPVAPVGPEMVSFTATQWRVAAVNGQTTPLAPEYSMRFVSGQLSARFGCNYIGGRYAMADGQLTTGELTQTLMGCPEPAGTFETQGSAVLRQPMRVVQSPDGGMTLTSAAGSIVLERAP